MATITKRGAYQWRAQIRKKGFPTISQTFDTRADAEDWVKIKESEMTRGVFQDRTEAEATTLKSALERYACEFTVHKKSRKSEEQKIKIWCQHPLASSSLASLRSHDFATFRDARLAQGKSAATVRLELAVISHLFTVATKEWCLPLTNPIINIRKPRVKNERARRLSPEEEAILLGVIEKQGLISSKANAWIAPMVRLALATAMRRSELLALEWKNVDLRNAYAMLYDTKNGENRAVPLSSTAKAVLQSLARSKNGKVFPISANAFSLSFKRALVRARNKYYKECRINSQKPVEGFLHDLHFHDLRHEATSRLFEKGLNQIEAASVTGHKTLSMLKRYTHLNPSDIAKKLE